jgi:hypothetical protein
MGDKHWGSLGFTVERGFTPEIPKEPPLDCAKMRVTALAKSIAVEIIVKNTVLMEVDHGIDGRCTPLTHCRTMVPS